MENSSPFAHPNNGQSIFVALRDVLAELYAEESTARVVVDDAGLDAKQIAFSSRSQTNWHNILAAAIRQARLDSLLKIALADYAANPALLAAYGQYRLWIEQGGSLEAPAALPADASVMISGDVNLKQGDFIGRDKNVRSIIAGRDVIGSLLVTGDHNQVFVGGYERLQDAYINPQSVFERVDLAHFTGREWLLAEVDAFLQNYDRGYFVIEANAGLGKTAFMAWLVTQRNYIHHFCELTPGLEGMAHALKSLAAQLVLAYELRPHGVLPSAASRPDFLYDLLVHAAQRRQSGEKIVVVVDALDEAGTPGNQNVLGLPTGLPEGVFFVISQRPSTTTLTIKDAKTICHDYRFAAESAENQADMRRFLEYAADLPEIVWALQAGEHNYTAEEFIATLLSKCRGVWIYLYFVVQEIRRGECLPLDLTALPDGMMHYYAQYWQRWRIQTKENEHAINPKWYQIYRPLLTMLAAAQEAVTIEQLLEWTKVNEPADLLRWYCEEQWRAFLIVTEQGQKRYYRLYHATLREFFAGHIEQEHSSVQPPIVKELAEATHAAHSCLVYRYLVSWGGLEDGLPGLRDPARRDLDERYGLRHLAAHLDAAGRIGELHHLLRTEWVRFEDVPYRRQGWRNWLDKLLAKQPTQQRVCYQNIWYTVREAVGQTDGYLADVRRAWNLVGKIHIAATHQDGLKREREQGGDWNSKPISLQYRYALIISSVNSLAANIMPGFLAELLKKGIWLPEQGLAYARQIPDAKERTKALTKLIPYLSTGEQEKVLEEALDIAKSIEDSVSKVEALVAVVPYCSLVKQEKVLQEVLAFAKHIEDNISKIETLVKLIPHLPTGEQTGVWQEALAIVDSIEYGFPRAKVLFWLVPHLSNIEQAKILQEILFIASNIGSDYPRIEIMVNLIPYLPTGEKESVLQEALTIAESVNDGYLCTEMLATVAPHLSVEQLQRALTIARGVRAKSIHVRIKTWANINDRYMDRESTRLTMQIVKESSSHAKALTNLASRLVELGQLRESFALVRDIKYSSDRAKMLASLAPHLSAEHLQEALAIARNLDDNSYCSGALADLASHLAQLNQLQEALTIARSIDDGPSCTEALTNLAPYLSAEHLQEALTIASRIEDNSSRTEALANLASRLAELGELQKALVVVRSIRNVFDRASAISKLASHLVKLEQPQEALLIVRNCIDIYERTIVLIDLAPHLSIEQLQDALNIAKRQRSSLSAKILTKLAPYVSAVQLQEALIIAKSIEDRSVRIEALANLAPYLSADTGEKVLQEALAIARSIGNAVDQAIELTYLAPYFLPDEQRKILQEVLDIAQNIEDNYGRAVTMVNLASRLADLKQFHEALAIIRNINDSSYIVQALRMLVPYLSVEQLQEALNIAENIEDHASCVDALVHLVPYFPSEVREKVLQQALSLTRSIKDPCHQVEALAHLATHLQAEVKEKVLQDALTITRTIGDLSSFTFALNNLAPWLLEFSQKDIDMIWTKILTILSTGTRFHLLSDVQVLMPLIARLGGSVAIVETAQAIQDVRRWWP